MHYIFVLLLGVGITFGLGSLLFYIGLGVQITLDKLWQYDLIKDIGYDHILITVVLGLVSVVFTSVGIIFMYIIGKETLSLFDHFGYKF